MCDGMGASTLSELGDGNHTRVDRRAQKSFSPVVRLKQGRDAVPRAGNETIPGGGQGFARVRVRAVSVA
jgi:hypothetical protein